MTQDNFSLVEGNGIPLGNFFATSCCHWTNWLFPGAVRREGEQASNGRVKRNLLQSFIAVVVGNAVYFLLLMPALPPAGRHGIDRIDLGLLIDFWVCVVVYGLISLVTHRRKARATRR